MEKLAFALITAARKLKPYFQAHTIVVLTDQPLKRVMSNPEVAGRMALWAIKLSEFDVQYRPRTAVKGQIVADFIAEYTESEDKGVEGQKLWSVHTDGSSTQQSGGAGVVILTPEGDKIECMIKLDFPTTNHLGSWFGSRKGCGCGEHDHTLRFPSDNKSGQRRL